MQRSLRISDFLHDRPQPSGIDLLCKRFKFVMTCVTLFLCAGCVNTILVSGPLSRFQYSEEFGKAGRQLQEEARNLPDRFYTDSLLTEAAVIQNRVLLEMLTVRGLRFVEVKIQRSNVKGQEDIGRLGMTSIDDEPGLRMKMFGRHGAYARVELSDISNPNCIAPDSLPQAVIRSRLGHPPILPDTCVAATLIDKPTATLAVVYEGKHPWGRPYGYWSLVERSTGRKLASMTSADSDMRPSNGGSGHNYLVDRIWNTPGFPWNVYRAVNQRSIKMATPVPDASVARTVKPAGVRYILVNQTEFDDIFNGGIFKKAGAGRWKWQKQTVGDTTAASCWTGKTGCSPI